MIFYAVSMIFYDGVFKDKFQLFNNLLLNFYEYKKAV